MIRKSELPADAVISLIGILAMMIFWGLSGPYGCPFVD
jgi:hypothetical protein